MSAAEVVDPACLARPGLATDVVVHAPAQEGMPWILQKGTHQYLRVGQDLADLARRLDGTTDHETLARSLGPRWSAELVGQAVTQLAGKGIIDDGSAPARRRRVRFMGVHRIQLTLLHPERLLAVLRPVIAVAGHRAVLALAALIAVGGLGALVVLGQEVTLALGTPMHLAGYLAIGIGFLLTTCIHELAHGAVLTAFGGRPTRMGVMLFYFTPAFFCDVTDGWRLPRRQQRVAVALAGIAVQAVVGGITALVALAPVPADVRQTLIVFAVLTYVACVMNLLPFIKLDGYLALMSHLDIPHLREKAMADARTWLAQVLFGARRERELPQLWWAVPFGLMSQAMPMYIVLTLLLIVTDLLLGLGAVGAGALLLIVGGALAYVVLGLVRLVGLARTVGAGRGRLTAVTGVLAAGAVALGALVPVPVTTNGGYVLDDGEAYLVLPSRTADLRVGEAVELHRRGVVTSTPSGAGTVAETSQTPVPTPPEAFLPVSGTGIAIDLPGYRLALDEPPVDAVGTATVFHESVPLWAWLAGTYLAPLGIDVVSAPAPAPAPAPVPASVPVPASEESPS